MASRNSRDIDTLWDYSDPAGSEARFRRQLARVRGTGSTPRRVELLTQVARARGLQGRFRSGHRCLDGARAGLPPGPSRVRVRYWLERGRLYNSEGKPPLSLPYFRRAWAEARRLGQDALAVDAAHMIAIALNSRKSDRWNRAGLRLAGRSPESRARRWKASLWNNLGWSQFARGEYAAAHSSFVRALRLRRRERGAAEVRVARWSVAKALRHLGRTSDALRIQQGLLAEHRRAGTNDGYVFEELGECLWTLGRREEARPHFRAAYAELRRDLGRAASESGRLERLRRRGQDTVDRVRREGRPGVPGRRAPRRPR